MSNIIDFAAERAKRQAPQSEEGYTDGLKYSAKWTAQDDIDACTVIINSESDFDTDVLKEMAAEYLGIDVDDLNAGIYDSRHVQLLFTPDD